MLLFKPNSFNTKTYHSVGYKSKHRENIVNKTDDLFWCRFAVLFCFFSLILPWFHQTGCFILNVNHFTWKVVIPNFLPILLVLDAYFFHYSQLWCCVRTIFLLWLLFFRSIYRPLLCSKGSKNWDWMHIYLQNVITITFQQHLIRRF